MIEKDEISDKKTRELLIGNMDTVKNNIKRLLTEKNMSQADLAFYAKSNAPFISYFLRKGGNATIEFIGKLAEVLDTDLRTLLNK